MKSILQTLASALPSDSTFDDLRRVLADLLGAEEISFFDADNRRISRDQPISEIIGSCEVEVRATFPIAESAHVEDEEASEPEYGNAADDFAGNLAPRATGPTNAAIEERVIREIYSRERNRKFVWAGYVVKTILPTLGVEQHAAQAILDRMVKDEILRLEKKHNPRNPEFPTTSVQLNHDHRTVRRIVSDNQSRYFQPTQSREDSFNSSDY